MALYTKELLHFKPSVIKLIMTSTLSTVIIWIQLSVAFTATAYLLIYYVVNEYVKDCLNGDRIKITQISIVLQEFFAKYIRQFLNKQTFKDYTRVPKNAYHEARQLLDIAELNLPVESLIELYAMERKLVYLSTNPFPHADLPRYLYPPVQQVAYFRLVESALFYVRKSKKAQEDYLESIRKNSRSSDVTPPLQSWRELLGLSRTEKSLEVAKKAYRRLASKHHPDKGGDENTFKKINEAYRQAQDALK